MVDTFADTDIAEFRRLMIEQLCDLSGGPCTYGGRTMAESHAGMGVTPAMFNALNLATLQTGRPAPLEAPMECAEFKSVEELLTAWLAWYTALKEAALPREEAALLTAQTGLLSWLIPRFTPRAPVEAPTTAAACAQLAVVVVQRRR